jgi:hypothetical protein
VIDAARKEQAAAFGLQEPAKKALATLDREWDGLIAHRDYPVIDLDNNSAERQLRGPVVTRKNAGGSRNGGAARNAARVWAVTATAARAGLNLQTYLAAYLDECGRNNGKPLAGPTPERFLPWAASPEDLHAWAQPPPPPKRQVTLKRYGAWCFPESASRPGGDSGRPPSSTVSRILVCGPSRVSVTRGRMGSSHRTIVIGNGPVVAAANRKAPTRGETALGGGTNRLHLRLGGGQVGRI